MSNRPWYKRYPADFIAGTLSLTLEEKGAYSVVLDLLYDRGAPIPDDARWIARVCGCSTRRWRQIRETLIAAGKLMVVDGHLTNARFNIQHLSEEKEAQKLAENGAKGAEKTNEKRASSKENSDLAEKGPPENDRHTRYQKPDSRKSYPPLSPHGFSEFWEAYPLRKARGAAEKAWAKAVKRAPPGEIIAAAERYRPPDPKFTKHPATWLNQDCWTDEPDHQVPRDPFLDAMRKEVADRQRRMDGWGSDDLDAAEEADPDGATGSAGRHPRLAYVADTCRPDGGHAGADPDQGPPEQAAAEIGGRVAGGYS
jgi:uncharacterized protein YdaU (DUF1376 family)